MLAGQMRLAQTNLHQQLGIVIFIVKEKGKTTIDDVNQHRRN